jgi:hypothetical protein
MTYQDTGTMRDSNIKSEIAKRLRKLVSTCYAAHVPYHHNDAPFSFMRLVPCNCCKRKWVPEIILSTLEPLPNLPVKGQGQFLEARVIRSRKSATGEADAVKISELLPFLEYDLQRQIILKLKIFGMNAVFGYTSKLQVGKSIVIATASCTALYVEALPLPPVLHISKNMIGETEPRLLDLQKNIEILIEVSFFSLFFPLSNSNIILYDFMLL